LPEEPSSVFRRRGGITRFAIPQQAALFSAYTANHVKKMWTIAAMPCADYAQ
jgi:hypothetical protein